MFLIAEGTPTESGFEQMLLMIGAFLILGYFMMWRPEQKRRKEMENKRNSLKKGDRVIVAGGIIGEIFKIQEQSIIISLEGDAKMEVMKLAIQDVENKEAKK